MYLRTMSVERRPVWTMITRSEAPPAAALVASRRVYDHLRWLIDMLGADLPVHVVRAMRPDGTPAHIREDTARE
ncbi:MAG: hypothetical protein JO352_24745 [Chloroflexi bacterium]|nr:hypothetical protein [Chloroflexota bacterium]